MKSRDDRRRMSRAMSGIFDGRPRKPLFGDINTLRAVTIIWIAFEHPDKFKDTADVIRWLQDNVRNEQKINATAWVEFLRETEIPLNENVCHDPLKKLKFLFPMPTKDGSAFSRIEQSVSRGMRANGEALGQEVKLANKSGRIYRKRQFDS